MGRYKHRLASTLKEHQDHMLARRSTEMNNDGAKSLPLPAVMSSESPPFSPPPPFPYSQSGPLPSFNLHHKPRDSPTLASFSDIPTNELPPIALSDRPCSLSPIGSQSGAPVLPPIATLTQSLEPLRLRTPSHPPQPSPVHIEHHRRPSPPRLTSWPTGNPLTTYYTPSHAQAAESPARMDVDMSTPRASSVSLDDPDVRMAAEALGDLRADFVSTPKQQPTQSQPRSQEPILQLLTTSHPLLAKTIEGTTTAYNTSKNYSPRFKTGAEYVEGYLTPIGNTLGSVGRVTGVEGGVRWFLKGSGRRQPSSSDLESGENSRSKRRRMMPSGDESDYAEDRRGIMSPPPPPSNMEFDPFAYRSKERRMSMSTVDSLPAYDDARSPAYTEAAGDDQRSPVPRSPAWQSRLIMSTSGLSIAMSEESLRSLKYCLQWLRWANDRIANVIGALKVTLEQFERHPETGEVTSKQVTIEIPIDGAMMLDEPRSSNESSERRSNEELGQRVAALKSDVLKTLRAVIETVSKYAGGALPDNARVLVKRHLTSLPQRFKLASQADQSSAGGPSSSGSSSDKDVREGAQRVLVLAQEGLDMMAQVSGVLDGTIVSAEEWCARLGKKKQDERAALADGANGQPEKPLEPLTSVGIDGDVKMG